MERITISLESDLAKLLDQLVSAHGYASRSEAIRDLIRGWHSDETLRQDSSAHCVAHVGYVYKHHDRSMAERMAEIQHQSHDLVVSSMHLHLDHDNCLEIALLRGSTPQVRKVAHAMIAQTGVRHGSVQLIPVERHAGGHGHSHGAGDDHVHMHPSN
jgi:CopG family nickel-responsive transcriptional regulator